jgi:hypothetical protein
VLFLMQRVTQTTQVTQASHSRSCMNTRRDACEDWGERCPRTDSNGVDSAAGCALDLDLPRRERHPFHHPEKHTDARGVFVSWSEPCSESGARLFGSPTPLWIPSRAAAAPIPAPILVLAARRNVTAAYNV